MSNYITIDREEYFKMLRYKTQLEKLERENDILRQRILRDLQVNGDMLFRERLKNDLLRKELKDVKCYIAILEK